MVNILTLKHREGENLLRMAAFHLEEALFVNPFYRTAGMHRCRSGMQPFKTNCCEMNPLLPSGNGFSLQNFIAVNANANI